MGNAISTVDETVNTLYDKYYPKNKWVSPVYASAIGMFGYLAKNFNVSQSVKLTSRDSFVYLFCLSSTLGLQMWVTFVSGLTMKRILPRHQFGQVQSALFPRYFFLNTLYTFGSLAVFTKCYPISTWKDEYSTMGLVLAGSFLLNALNSMFLSPKTVTYLNEMHEIEKRAGVGLTTVGKLIMESKLENDAQYKEVTTKFHMYHGVSMLANFASFVATVGHVYLLTSGNYVMI